jgi:hypothetical protein
MKNRIGIVTTFLGDPIVTTIDDDDWDVGGYAENMPHVILFEREQPRTYVIGCPVTVEVDDEGRVTVTTYLGEAAEAVADYDDGEPVAMVPGMLDEQAEDAATIAAAIAAGNYSATTREGA